MFGSVKNNASTSTTQFLLDNNISQLSVNQILKKTIPYKIHLLHEQYENDPDKRKQFCAMMMDIANANTNFTNLNVCNTL